MPKVKQRQKLHNILTGGHKDAMKILNTVTHRTGSVFGKKSTFAKDLSYTASKFGLIGLANNQAQDVFDYFTVSREIRNLSKPQWLNHHNIRSDSYRIICSPCVTKFEGDIIWDWEYSPSFPNIRAKVPRYEKTEFRYLNIQGDNLIDQLEGFTSRVFQHFLDQIGGYTIINPAVSYGNVEIVPGTEEWHGEEVCDAVEYYSDFIKKNLPEKDFKMRTFDRINNQLSSENIIYDENQIKRSNAPADLQIYLKAKEKTDAVLPLSENFLKESRILYEELGYFYDDLFHYHEEKTRIKNWNIQKSLGKDDSVEVFKSFIVNQ